eukprot:Gb_32032 [translate_table: standard]
MDIRIILLLCVFLWHLPSPSTETHSKKKSYVVYLGGHEGEVEEENIALSHHHHQMLSSVLGSHETAKECILYSRFQRLLCSTRTPPSSCQLRGVVSMFPSRAHSLHTTRSWDFLSGLGHSELGEKPFGLLWKKAADESRDVIIANIDSGIWPESESFGDKGMDPVPSRWKGVCQNGTQFGSHHCNRKLIGARYFIKGFEAADGPLDPWKDFRSPRDRTGHGTHTLSIAGRRFVRGANMFGFANGTAKGGSPNARVAAYKVCWIPTKGDARVPDCHDDDILAAFDAAISDGVDVFSISLGSSVQEYLENSIAIGSFHAVQRGKIVACSAGNDGYKGPGTVVNVAPWILTVGASSIDRDFPSWVTLGNNRTYRGQSLSEFHLPMVGFYPLISSSTAGKPSNPDHDGGKHCLHGALDPDKVKGKIVVCDSGSTAPVEKGEAVRMAGGVGMILCNDFDDVPMLSADPYLLPASRVGVDDGNHIFNYIDNEEYLPSLVLHYIFHSRFWVLDCIIYEEEFASPFSHWMDSCRSPVANISPGRTELNVAPAPVMAFFSSQGPNTLTPDILKPDIIAPGVNILGAWPPPPSPSGFDFDFDHRHIKFKIESGTSVSCPHVAGIATLLKAVHPLWSPAAIQSAIMTTATTMDNKGDQIRQFSLEEAANPLNYGSGHVNPNAAADPGLVYNRSESDYFLFLCGLNYDSTLIRMIAGKDFSCPSNPPKAFDLNYPSVTVSNLERTQIVRRNLTNVGRSGVYRVEVSSPPDIEVTIEPKELQFREVGETKSFSVKLTALDTATGEFVFGEFTWTDGRHNVTSPIVVNNVFESKAEVK